MSAEGSTSESGAQLPIIVKLQGFTDPALHEVLPGAARVAREAIAEIERLRFGAVLMDEDAVKDVIHEVDVLLDSRRYSTLMLSKGEADRLAEFLRKRFNALPVVETGE